MLYQVAVDPIARLGPSGEALEGVADSLPAAGLPANSGRVEDDIFSRVLFEPSGKVDARVRGLNCAPRRGAQ